LKRALPDVFDTKVCLALQVITNGLIPPVLKIGFAKRWLVINYTKRGVTMFEAKRVARLKWACRRGMLELDVLFLPFVEQGFDALNFAQQETFERLLTCDDPDLFAWFMGHQTCHDPELADMVKTVLSRVKLEVN
jgi:antitoxin CptB